MAEKARVFIPRSWQVPAIEHLTRTARGALYMPPGLGKTASVLKALALLDKVEPVFPALVTAPLRVARDTWADEVAKWTFSAGVKVAPVIGDLEQRMDALRSGAHIYTINPEQLAWLIKLYGNAWPFTHIVSDEFTMFKGARVKQGGKRAGLVRQVAWLPQVRRFWGLTGTPAPNGLQDLFGQMLILDQGTRLGRSYSAFTDRWFQKGYDGFSMEAMPHAQKEIQERIRDICLSIRAEDWIKVDQPVVNTIRVHLQPPAWKVYKEMEKQMFTIIDREGIEAVNAAVARSKCMQIADGGIYGNTTGSGEWKQVHDEKLLALDSLLMESGGTPLLVAYTFKFDKAKIMKRYPEAVDLSKADGLAKFRTGKAPIGLAHPKSLGHGIDGLQDVTNIMVYYSHGDNLEHHQQVLERIGPMRQMQSGHNRAVYVHHIVAANTVEEYAVLPNLEGKGRIQDLLLQAMRRL